MSNAAHNSAFPPAPRAKPLRAVSGSFSVPSAHNTRTHAGAPSPAGIPSFERGASGSVVTRLLTRAECLARANALDALMRDGWEVDGVHFDPPTNGELARRICRDEKCVRRLRDGAGRITDEMIDGMGSVGAALRARLVAR